MASSVPSFKLNNGKTIPILGLGTWNSPKGEVEQAVKDAIDAGYRHIDGAHFYGNENELGDGVNSKITEGVIKREDVFITSKLWNTFNKPSLVRGAIEVTLKNLNTPYVDLYLIHWPQALQEDNGLFPMTADGKLAYSDADYVDTWKELERAVDDGLVKSIGVSNFNHTQLERLLAVARIPPAINQVECHPYLTQKKLSAFCAEKGIVFTSYSPLGSPTRPWAKADEPVLLEDEKLKALAVKYGKSVGQVLIRYQTQRGHVVIPKSVTKARIISNMDVFGFELSAEDLALIDSFDCNGRLVAFVETASHPNYPFNAEY